MERSSTDGGSEQRYGIYLKGSDIRLDTSELDTLPRLLGPRVFRSYHHNYEHDVSRAIASNSNLLVYSIKGADGKDGPIRILSLRTSEWTRILGARSKIVDCSFSSDNGEFFAAVTEDGTFGLWIIVEFPREIGTSLVLALRYDGLGGAVEGEKFTKFAWHPTDSAVIALATSDRRVIVMNLLPPITAFKNGDNSMENPMKTSEVDFETLSDNGLDGFGTDQSSYSDSSDSDEVTTKMYKLEEGEITDLSFSKTGDEILVSSTDGSLHVWNVRTDRYTATHSGYPISSFVLCDNPYKTSENLNLSTNLMVVSSHKGRVLELLDISEGFDRLKTLGRITFGDDAGEPKFVSPQLMYDHNTQCLLLYNQVEDYLYVLHISRRRFDYLTRFFVPDPIYTMEFVSRTKRRNAGEIDVFCITMNSISKFSIHPSEYDLDVVNREEKTKQALLERYLKSHNMSADQDGDRDEFEELMEIVGREPLDSLSFSVELEDHDKEITPENLVLDLGKVRWGLSVLPDVSRFSVRSPVLDDIDGKRREILDSARNLLSVLSRTADALGRNARYTDGAFEHAAIPLEKMLMRGEVSDLVLGLRIPEDKELRHYLFKWLMSKFDDYKVVEGCVGGRVSITEEAVWKLYLYFLRYTEELVEDVSGGQEGSGGVAGKKTEVLRGVLDFWDRFYLVFDFCERGGNVRKVKEDAWECLGVLSSRAPTADLGLGLRYALTKFLVRARALFL